MIYESEARARQVAEQLNNTPGIGRYVVLKEKTGWTIRRYSPEWGGMPKGWQA